MQIPLAPFPAKRIPLSPRGFSLVEIAVVLVIISVLLTIVAVPVATQIEQRRVDETQKLLENAKDALYGFVAANGRLPCPAVGATGQESPIGGGTCTALVGLLPAVTLGLSPVDASGFVIDAWADGNPLRRVGYAVSNLPLVVVAPAVILTPALTTTDGVKVATMATVAASAHLYVCSTGLTAASPATNCAMTVTMLTDKAPAVLFSLGKNSATNSFDEANNQNVDKVFSSGTQTATYDDIVVWMSLNLQFDRMVKAGKLP